MIENGGVELEQFRVTCGAVKRLEINVADSLSNSPNRLVGYADYIDVFRSLVPIVEYDAGGDISVWEDFTEIFPDAFPYEHTTSAAVLLTGQTGCGRHTADRTLMSVALEAVQNAAVSIDDDDLFGIFEEPDPDRSIRYYLIDFHALGFGSERILMKNLDALFLQMAQTAIAEPSVVFYFSLGDVTEILNHQRLSARFLYHVGRLTGNPGAHCILTCIYEGKAETLTENLKKPFYVLEFDLPTKRARQEYFQYLTDRYMNIKIDLSADELTEQTEGFSFAMIKKLAAHMMMTVKAEIVAKKLNPENYVRQATINELEVLIIDKKKINRLIQLIKSTCYTEPETPAPAYTVPYPLPYPPQSSDVPVQAAAAAPKPSLDMNDDDIDKSVEAKIEEIDTPKQFFEMRDSLLRPTGYSPVILMEHGKMNSQAFREENVSLRDFLLRCREEGYTSLENIHTAFVEANRNGGLGFRPLDSSLLTEEKPALSELSESVLFGEVIIEGNVLSANLGQLGHDTEWLQAQLRQQGYSSASEIFLGICDKENKLILYPYER